MFRRRREMAMYAQTRFPPIGPPPAQPGHRPGDDALRAVSFATLAWLAYLLTLLAWRWREDYRVR